MTPEPVPSLTRMRWIEYLTSGADGSWWRYGIAWIIGAAPVWGTVLPMWDAWYIRAGLGVGVGLVAVVAAFALGLLLRIPAMGRDWHRCAAVMACALPVALAVSYWAREVATWIFGVDLRQTESGEPFAMPLAVGGWFAAVFLAANFPRRSRIGLGFAATFSPAKRRVLRRGGIVAALGLAAWWLLPAPLTGYWHTPFSDCLCDSKNLIVFEDGHVYRWASAHGLAREPLGTYHRHFRWVTWDDGKQKIELRPGWLFMTLRSPKDDTVFPDKRWVGYREWRRDYIREVLATKPLAHVPSRGADEITAPAKAGTDSGS